jgi:hypothetical protein
MWRRTFGDPENEDNTFIINAPDYTASHGRRENIKNFKLMHFTRSRDSSFSIVTNYGLDGQVSSFENGKRFLSNPQHPDRLWSLTSLLSSGYRGPFPKEQSLHIVPSDAIPPCPPYVFMTRCKLITHNMFTSLTLCHDFLPCSGPAIINGS